MRKKRTPKATLTTYMNSYLEIQEHDLYLCYRKDTNSGWSNRCEFLDEKYSPMIPYNHRTILDQEVVIEFDNDDTQKNLINAEKVTKKLIKHKIKYSLWHSGNKSYHVHCLLKFNVGNPTMLKKAFMRWATKDLDELPDMQLAGRHLIRAEWGIHEKTQNNKTRIRESAGYPCLSNVPQEVWESYLSEKEKYVKRRMTDATQDISESAVVKQLLDTTYISEVGDGRERSLFALSNVLCVKYEQKELETLLWDWYRYSNGSKLSEGQVKYKVRSAYKKRYIITEYYLKQLLEELSA